MTKILKLLFIAYILLSTGFCVVGQQAWHYPLYLDGNYPHAKRVEITFENKTANELDGEIFRIPAKKLGIASRPTKELRVVGENGRELLFDVIPESDTIGENSTLAVPVACKPNSKTRVWVYYDNPHAWELPSNLNAEGVSDINEKLDFEALDKLPPSGWHDNSKENYKNSLEKNGGKDDSKCVSTTAGKGSTPQWVCISRSFKVNTGDKYKLSGWVRGENVKGQAGFYIHEGQKNIHKDQNNGSFDWKKIEFEGIIPEGVKELSFGTVLYATEGKAWFDDLQVNIERAQKNNVKISIGQPESLELASSGESDKWQLSSAKYPSRIKFCVRNISPLKKGNVIACASINRITNANYEKEAFAVIVDGKRRPFFLASGYMLASVGDIEPMSEKVFYVYLNKNKKNQIPNVKGDYASGILSDYKADAAASADVENFGKIMNSATNLLKNPSFEMGTESWGGTMDTERVAAKIVEGGLYGEHAAMLEIKDPKNSAWHGFRQAVPGIPGNEYIIAGWCRLPDGGAGTIHAHYDFQKGGFNAYSSTVMGDKWQIFAMFMPATGPGNVSVHLTATTGKYIYDGIIVAESVKASALGYENIADLKRKNQIAVWQTDNIIKIFPGDYPKAETEPYLELAGNEYEGMQLAIRNSEEIKSLKVSVDAPVYTGEYSGETPPSLPAPQIGHIENVIIDTASAYFHFTDLKKYERFVSPNNFVVLYPDPIIPSAKFDLPAKQTKGVYLTFYTPKDTKPGIYEGKIELKSEGKTLKTLPYKIKVYDFSLSDEPLVYAIFDIRLSSGAQYKNYTHREAAKFMKSKKLSVDTLPARITFKLENGKPVADFSKFDKEAEYYLNELKLPYLYLPFSAGTFGWGNPPRPYLGENPYPGKWPYENADHTRLNPKYREYIVESLKQISKHLEEKGWTDRFMYYISDEPFASRINIEKQMIALCDAIHEGAPKMKIYCSTWKYVPKWVGKLDIWGVGAQGQASENEIKLLKDSGADIITTTDGHFVLDNPYNALERLMPLYCYKYGFKGYEFWGADWYTLNPLKWGIHLDIPQSDTPGKHYRVRYPNGDGYIFYPGKLIGQKEPFASVRMESHRDGVEDYEYFVILEKLAKQKGDKAALDALERIKKMAFIPNAGGRNAPILLPNPEEYTKLRREIAHQIERLKSNKSDPEEDSSANTADSHEKNDK